MYFVDRNILTSKKIVKRSPREFFLTSIRTRYPSKNTQTQQTTKPIRTFEDLDVWETRRDPTLIVYETTSQFPVKQV